MNIIMFTNSYKPLIGRVPISIERLPEGLRSLGHRVTVLVPEPEGKLSTEQEKDVVRFKVFYRKADRGMALGNCFGRRIEAFFREGNFDVVHVRHPALVGRTVLYLGKKYNTPVAYTHHTRYEEHLHHSELYETTASGEYPVSRVVRYGRETLVPALITALSNQCDLVFALASMIEDHLLEQGTKTRMSVLPTGLDRVLSQYDETLSSEIRDMYGNGCPYLFATIARLEKERNLDFLLRGTVRLRDILGQNFRLMAVGGGAERRHLEELARILGTSRQIVFTGKTENTRVWHHLNAADAFLFASKSETQGVALLGATVMGCPVAAVRASGIVDVVRQGINGYMTEEAPEAFAAAATRLASERGVWSEMSEEARKAAELYESGRIAALAAEQYGLMTGQREGAGYEEHGRGMLVPLILRLFKTA